MNTYTKPNVLDSQQIFLSFYQKTLELSLHELKPCEKTIIFDNSKQVIEQEDTRISFIQSVEMLAFALKPFYDTEMKKVYNANIKILGGLAYEIEKTFDDEDFKGYYQKSNIETKNHLIIFWQLRKAKLIFSELTELLKRINFLKSATYDEDEDLEGGQ
jgi:hypothetical protein